MSAARWRLDGRVAIVTGAGRGLGAACALALAEAGATLLLVARTRAEVEAGAAAIVAAGGSARAHVADVTEAGAVTAIVAAALALGDLRIAVNCAGSNRVGAARDYALADWDRLFALNVRAAFAVCQAVGASLLARGVPGSLVTLSSQMGHVGARDRVAYCASKHAVEGMTKALAVEWAPHGIRVNTVAPTFVDTPLTAPMLADPGFRAAVLERIPAGELATAAQVADAVRYLACDAAGSVTGASLRVDGGWTAC